MSAEYYYFVLFFLTEYAWELSLEIIIALSSNLASCFFVCVCLQARMMAALKVYATSAAAADTGFLCVRTNWYGTRREKAPEREAILAVAVACQVWVVPSPICRAHRREPSRPTSPHPPTWSPPPPVWPRKNNCVWPRLLCNIRTWTVNCVWWLAICPSLQLFVARNKLLVVLWREWFIVLRRNCKEHLLHLPVLIGCFGRKLLGHNCCLLHEECCSKCSRSVATLKLRGMWLDLTVHAKMGRQNGRMNNFDGACRDCGSVNTAWYCCMWARCWKIVIQMLLTMSAASM